MSSAGLPTHPELSSQFQTYRDMLIDWNGRMNLISKRDEERIVSRHFLQSIALAAIIEIPTASRIMDLGSGAGFPGLPLKMVRPDLLVSLVESRKKKTLFLEAVIQSLALTDIHIYRRRIEEMNPGEVTFDLVVCRAVSDLATLAKWSQPFLSEKSGRLVAIKGPDIDNEMKTMNMKQSRLGFKEVQIHPFNPFPDLAPFRESIIVEVQWGSF